MRDQQVHHTWVFLVALIRKELEYFGFHIIPNEAIDWGSANKYVAEHIVLVNKEHTSLLDHLKNATDGIIVANLIFRSR